MPITEKNISHKEVLSNVPYLKNVLSYEEKEEKTFQS